MAESMMIDDEEARTAWRKRFEEHVTAIMEQMGYVGRFELADTPVTAAMVQAYHEGVERLRKRSSN